MDEERFDRWTRGLPERISRRGLSGVVAGAFAALGLAATAEAKKKKRKKKRKKKKQQPPPPPPPYTPPPRECIEGGFECSIGYDTCCSSSVAAVQQVCTTINPANPDPISRCCYRSGTRTSEYMPFIQCCGLQFKPDVPNGSNTGPGVCCIRNGQPLLEGDTPDHCCDHPATNAAGECCIPSGQPCDNSRPLCCDGSTCSGATCP